MISREIFFAIESFAQVRILFVLKKWLHFNAKNSGKKGASAKLGRLFCWTRFGAIKFSQKHLIDNNIPVINNLADLESEVCFGCKIRSNAAMCRACVERIFSEKKIEFEDLNLENIEEVDD